MYACVCVCKVYTPCPDLHAHWAEQEQDGCANNSYISTVLLVAHL